MDRPAMTGASLAVDYKAILLDLWRQNNGLYRTIAHRYLPNNADIEDCLQDAFLVAWRKIDETKPDKPKCWLARVVKYEAIDKARSAKIRQTANLDDVPEPSYRPVDAYMANYLAGVIAERVLGLLPAERRAGVIAWMDSSYGEGNGRADTMRGPRHRMLRRVGVLAKAKGWSV